jgi:hypothetical protein
MPEASTPRRVVKKRWPKKAPPMKRPTRQEDGSKMPIFYGPHHQALAGILKGQRPYKDPRAEMAWDAQVRGFAHCLSLDNALFDTDRFFRECGGLPTHKEAPK